MEVPGDNHGVVLGLELMVDTHMVELMEVTMEDTPTTTTTLTTVLTMPTTPMLLTPTPTTLMLLLPITPMPTPDRLEPSLERQAPKEQQLEQLE